MSPKLALARSRLPPGAKLDGLGAAETMPATFEPRLDILPASQRHLWPELDAVPSDFVLYRGTALALQLGHRVSEDFDFFSSAGGLRRPRRSGQAGVFGGLDTLGPHRGSASGGRIPGASGFPC